MKIKGLKYLRKNDYDKITITRGSINVYGSSTWESLKLSHGIDEELKKLSDEEQIDRVTEYFTDYHQLTTVDENYFHAGKHYIAITALNNESLKYRIQPSGKSVQRIIDKYQLDRVRFLDEAGVDEYVFKVGGVTEYHLDEENKLHFVLYRKNGTLISMEREFIEFVLPQLWGENIVTLEKKYRPNRFEADYWDIDGYYVTGGDNQVKIDLELIELVRTLIIEHNVRIRKMQEEDAKVYQMKMEGF